MAYNNYNPLNANSYYGAYNNGYQPYQNLSQQQQQFNRQPINMQTQFDLPIQFFGFGTKKEAEPYIVNPNCCAIFIDRTNNVVYFKSADSLGQSFMKYFSLKEIDENQLLSNSPNKVVEFNPNDYVKKQDLNDLVKSKDLEQFITKEQYTKLLTDIDNLNRRIKMNDILEAEKNGRQPNNSKQQ